MDYKEVILALTTGPLRPFQDKAFISFWYVCNIVALITYILTLIHKNYSQVDRIWPLITMFWSWCFLGSAIYYNPGPEPAVQIDSEIELEDFKSSYGKSLVLESDSSSIIRLVIMSLFITMWSCRLTYNFWRKGGYQRGHEDYRWVHVKKMFGYPETKWKFHLLNFFFIAFFQCWLLYALTFSMWFIQTNKTTKNSYKQEPFNWLDMVLSLLWLTFFAIEVIGDSQQFKFQTTKYKYLDMSIKGKKQFKEEASEELMADIKRGFLTRGLWRYSRHPNFFGELGMWWTIAAFSISCQLTHITRNFSYVKLLPFNYAFIGVVCLTALFHESTKLTERITSSKYSDYKQYKNSVSRIIFWLPGNMSKKD